MAVPLSPTETIKARNAYSQYAAKVQAMGQEAMTFEAYVRDVWKANQPKDVE